MGFKKEQLLEGISLPCPVQDSCRFLAGVLFWVMPIPLSHTKIITAMFKKKKFPVRLK
jgi:hypothetical protein